MESFTNYYFINIELPFWVNIGTEIEKDHDCLLTEIG